MAFFGPEERARLKRLKIEQAVNFAMQSRWAEAAELNRQLIDVYPKEVEAHNRLGKAMMELGKYEEARQAYNHALRIEPTNMIAQKNMQRLDTLRTEVVEVVAPSGPVDPSLFITETGRATITSLVELAPSEVLAAVDAGDPVALEVEDSTVVVRSAGGDLLGKLEPRLRQRLIRLAAMGNEYGAVVSGVDEQSLRIIIRETRRDPSMGDRPSFPTTGEAFRGYTRDSLIRYEFDEEEEEELEDLDVEHEHEVEAGVEREPDLVHEVLRAKEQAEDGEEEEE